MLIDSNILIYSLNLTSPKYREAQLFLQQQSQLVFAQQNIFETLRILTHPKFPNPYPAGEAIRTVRAIVDQGNIIQPTYETTEIALELIQKFQIVGAEVFDAFLVATAISNGIKTIATDNVVHLKKYPLIALYNPFLS